MKSICLALSLAAYAHAGVFNDRAAFHQLVYEIRDPETESERFRDCLEKIGEYLALEVLQDLSSADAPIKTLTGAVATHSLRDEEPALVCILRAGMPLVLGVHKIFPEAELGFLGMARDEETLLPRTDYIALPDVRGKVVILADTMLATGGSALRAIELIQQYNPKKIIMLCAIASQTGIERVSEMGIEIYPAAIDPLLNEKGYIVPGLGDAGDRSYGRKY